MGIIDVEAKCRALLLTRVWTQSKREGSSSAEWLQCWKQKTNRANTPCPIPKTLEYLHIYVLRMTYTDLPRQGETPRMLGHKVYETLRTISTAGNRPRDKRITQLHPTTYWKRVWKNLHATWSSDVVKAVWYTVIHDILPTNERLHIIRLTCPNVCRTCGEDTCNHQINECGEGKAIWEWARKNNCMDTRKDPSRISEEGILRLEFQIWPPRRHRAMLWILPHMVWFRMRERRSPSA